MESDAVFLWAKIVEAQRSIIEMLETPKENREFDAVRRNLREKSNYDESKGNQNRTAPKE